MIRLTTFDILEDKYSNKEIFVNENNILYMKKNLPYPCTLIVFKDDTKITVKENCNKIIKLIRGKKK